MTITITTRPVTAADSEFCRRVFRDTLAPELAALGDAFCQWQFELREASYQAADDAIVLAGDEPAGRIVVRRSPVEIRIVDIELLADHRGRGLGTAVLAALTAEAARSGVPVRLSVVADSPAVALYRRLGFAETSGDGHRLEMEWNAL